MAVQPPASPELTDALERSKALGFLGPGEIDVHLGNARSFLDLLPVGSRVLDLGSGGGLPGLVIADERPDVELLLVDAMEKRVAFLRDVVRNAPWKEHVGTECGRAEVLAHRTDLRFEFDRVVVRSFGPPAATAECAVGFLNDGGEILVSEPLDRRSRWPYDGLALLGLEPSGTTETPHAMIQHLRRVGPVDDRYPRKIGIPVKKPLFDTI